MMSLGSQLPTSPTRFSWVTLGERQGPDEVFDEDLGSYAEAAVIPTRGAIIPEWLLVVPRVPCLSSAELKTAERVRLLEIAANVSVRVSARAGASVIFEHGPGRQESAIGCGVDQAHLHVVGGAPGLLDRLVENVNEVPWSSVDYADPWLDLPPGSNYFMIRDDQRAVLAIVGNATSQRLRKAMADLLGRGYEWDYRSHPNALIARETKRMFCGAFANAAA